MKHFTIQELTKTVHGKNEPNQEQIKNLVLLIEKVLDPARDELGAPIVITSGFRSAKVNKAVRGAANSQHCKGQAADITCYNNRALFRIIQDMEFDQLIYEFGDDDQPSWIHVSYSSTLNRNHVLRAKKSAGKTVYLPY
jgi:zinc D-Ala-D-Ala carboxypeptidase